MTLTRGGKNRVKRVMIRIIPTLIAFLLIGTANLWAAEDKPSVSAEAGVFSKYIWRGYELSDDSLVIQPSMTVAYKGFSMNLWGNLDTDFDNMDPATSDRTEWTETDLTLAYERRLGPAILGVGYIYYALDGADDSQELYISAALDIPLSPTICIYREVAHLPGWYIDFAIGHTFKLPKGMSLNLEGSIGYYHSDDDSFVEVDDNLIPTDERYRNFHDGEVSVSLSVPLGKAFTLTPMVAYSYPLSDNADNLLTATSFSRESDFLYGGVSLAIAF